MRKAEKTTKPTRCAECGAYFLPFHEYFLQDKPLCFHHFFKQLGIKITDLESSMAQPNNEVTR